MLTMNDGRKIHASEEHDEGHMKRQMKRAVGTGARGEPPLGGGGGGGGKRKNRLEGIGRTDTCRYMTERT